MQLDSVRVIAFSPYETWELSAEFRVCGAASEAGCFHATPVATVLCHRRVLLFDGIGRIVVSNETCFLLSTCLHQFYIYFRELFREFPAYLLSTFPHLRLPIARSQV